MNKSKLQRHCSSCLLLSSILLNASVLSAQEPKETTQELSKAARKGMLYSIDKKDDGNLHVTYLMRMNTKSDEVSYEDYVFDPNLDYKGAAPVKVDKKYMPDIEQTSIVAYVGGGNSFNVLSMGLHLQREVWSMTWDYNKQTYRKVKRLSKQSVKPANSESKYRGFASFNNEKDFSIFVIASYDQDKNDDDQFVCLHIDGSLKLKETKVPVDGAYSLVYCDTLESGNAFMVLAPNKGMGDTRKYVYAEFTRQADLVTKTEFTAPSPNTLIMSHSEVNGDLYFCAASTDKKDAYNSVFTSYAPILNPGFPAAANRQMEKYEKKVYGVEFDNFHFLKMQKGQLAFATTTPVDQMKSKVKTPPSQKKAHPYKGRKLDIQSLEIAPNGNFLMAGQLTGRDMFKGEPMTKYYDIVAFMFNPQGELITQYAVEKMNNDSKSEIFSGYQSFYFSPDGKTTYWQIMEVKGLEGYANLADALRGTTTFIPAFFPRIAKINLADGNIGDFTILGSEGKYHVMNPSQCRIIDNTLYYFGNDHKYQKIWVGKYPLN